MPLSDIVQVNITATAATPSQLGFGIAMLVAYHTHYLDRVREYSGLADMVSDGFTTSEPAYKMAQAAFSQAPRPPSVKIGRKALPAQQVLWISCNVATVGAVYDMTIGGQAVTYTVASGDTTAIATAIAAEITALSLSGVAVSTSTNKIILTQSGNILLDVVPDHANTTFFDDTADAGVATDLAAILAADADFYGVALDSNSKAEVAAAAAWAESADQKLFVWETSDTAAMDSTSTTDVMYVSKASAYKKSGGIMSADQLLSYRACAWIGAMFPNAPGSDNWAFKSLAGQIPDVLTTTQIHAVENKNGSVYTVLQNVPLTQFGKVSSGEWFDVERFIDWVVVQLQSVVLGAFANNKKIPYTDAGVDVIKSLVMGVLEAGVAVGGFAATPKYTITAPAVATVTAADKANRNLPNVNWTATLAGAINKVTINGTVST